ncbi:MAG: pilus assembly protein PilY [Geobacter sp.]|nr:MAG: pilus assembly protein PilY [Geobacter sp.]
MKAVSTFIKMLPVVVALLISLIPGLVKADPGNNYCVTPAFIAGGIPPNLLLMLDNSASMYDPAYTKAGGVDCYDDSYDNTKDYIGYFSKLDTEGNITYPYYQFSYNTSAPLKSKFVEVAALPTGGTYQTPYLHITMTGTKGGADRQVSEFAASGRFLNWLSASKFDTQKQALTGGKYDMVNQYLISESRGCVGRRFVRELPLSAWTSPSGLTVNPITFAARGPNSVEPNYSPDTAGGLSRIEIFEADFNQAACSSAATNWNDGNYGTASTQTGNCLDISGSDPTGIKRTLTTLNHTMQTCWLLKDNIRKGATTMNAIWQGVNTTDVTGDCEKVYTTDATPPSSITNKADGRYVCTSALTGVWPNTHQLPVGAWAAGGVDQSGFIGQCWNTNSLAFKDNNGVATTTCIERELLHYCMGQETEVIDPTSTAPSGGGIPGILMDAGIRAVGEPIGPVGSGTIDPVTGAKQNLFYVANVAATTPPSGLLQKYGNYMRIGAMQINPIGSASETMPGPVPSGNKDGGKIVSFIGAQGICSVTTATLCSIDADCPSGEVCNSAGSHENGLVQHIDGIDAGSWTPYAEAYYNAIAYFAKDAVATNSILPADKFTPPVGSPAIAEPLAGTDSYTNVNPIQFRCQANNIMLITDGGSTADQNSTMKSKVKDASNLFRDPNTLAEAGSTSDQCGPYSGSPFLHDLSYYARHRDIFDPTISCASGNCDSAQTISTHVIYTGPATSGLTGVCDPRTQMQLTATNGGTDLLEASDPKDFYAALRGTFMGLVAKSASGTAASILSNSEGSGANILQAVFFPKKYFLNDTTANWVGEMQNLWYYVDPRISKSTIREDTIQDHKLNLTDDYVATFEFNTVDNQTVVKVQQDTNGDGVADGAITIKNPDDLKSIWFAGNQLWARTTARDIRTPCVGSASCTSGLMDFSTTNASTLSSYLQAPDTNTATKIIKYVQGIDLSTLSTTDPYYDADYRSRTVTTKKFPSGLTETHVWKLGDIISSTPRLQSTSRLNTYDYSAPAGYSDTSYASFLRSNQYKQRGMVYVGANDGMLHAFRLGILKMTPDNFTKATLEGTGLGEEVWSFIPKNALPYLGYTTDKYYNHIYFVDGSTTLLDASIGDYTGTNGCTADTYDVCEKNPTVVDTSNNLDPAKNTWRTVLIGGMGLGGASRNAGDTCIDTSAGTCVKTPINGLGYSSYFALDVSDDNNPKFMWEFSNPALGYTTAGPAIVRVGPSGKNGRWYAVFGSGPTGPIDTITHQFLGRSDQTLKFFVVDLNAKPPFVLNSNYWVIDTDIADAFTSSMTGGSIDTDRWNTSSQGRYQDEAIYVGYTKKGSGGEWNDGGVLRIMTKEITDLTGPLTAATGPATWQPKVLIDGIGPVTTAIARLQDRKNHQLWLYFGTGRYFFRYGNNIDDYSSQRTLYGVKEPCYTVDDSLDTTCSTQLSSDPNPLISGITDRTTVGTTPDPTVGTGGWKVDLEPYGASYGAERVVTNTVTLTNGAIFFTTFEPTADACGFGGNSFLWALDYNTGLRPPDSTLVGKALIQLSTGEFKEVNLSEVFTARDGRRMGTAMTGKPPGDAPPILSTSGNKPIKRILHIQER